MLINGLAHQAKRGFPCNYSEISDSYAGVKGKIDFNLSLTSQTFQQGKIICTYDEFLINRQFSGTLKTTLMDISKTKGLSESLRKRTLHWLKYFSSIEYLPLSKSIFSHQLMRTRSVSERFLLHVCQLINESLLINEQSGSHILKDFWRDERSMAILFEAFVRNFYRIEQKTYNVRREVIHWQLNSNEFDSRLLPIMRTDITLENMERKLIIDTKFYAGIFQQYFNVQKLHSPHLYQLFAYLKNQSNKERRCDGMLLYPTVSQTLSSVYSEANHTIHMETINLNQPWQNIKLDLLKLIS